MNTKRIVVNGVTYEVTKKQNKSILFCLSRARIVNDGRESTQTSSLARGMAPAAREVLTNEVVRRLIGHTNVVYYNFDTNLWNTNRYNGYIISGQHNDTNAAIAFRNRMQREPKFNTEYEFVAPVTQTIDAKFYQGYESLINNPIYSEEGSVVVANIIARNKKTGKCELYGNVWIGVYDFWRATDAVWNGAFRASYRGSIDPSFRAILHAAHNVRSL